eukprot:SAG11_NODE_16_length_26235_cov_39.900417_16_plen_36_part_00
MAYIDLLHVVALTSTAVLNLVHVATVGTKPVKVGS